MDEAALNARVGATVRALREKSGFSMRELARRSGVSQPFLSQIERGVSAPSMVTTYRLAEALGVLPGALLPAPAAAQVTVVRAGEGRDIPVANRPDAAVGRALLMQPGSPLEIIEYRIEPGGHIAEWFEMPGDLGVYLIEGRLDVEVDGYGVVRLAAGDFVAHPASIPHRWHLVDDEPARALLAIAHAPEGARHPSGHS
ncbi:helix-turn-helix domain-containing protein [Pseudonocardia alaniniphila]|uniref:XRE family transcriptional regulator n=1 Tax=Pseudonocardia alaniniphila TaxID=75291 RepID=A0ABS9TRQ5_9PSEU|nr:XRE family transcriptional regulator [Pseudonocardia alaniniphila]MCH6171206.1 XRE family transcriptional regulator [Pseudonocardia alaniniphila]